MSYQLAFASFLLAACQELANLPSQASETDPAAQSSTAPTSNADTDVTKDSGNEPKVETSSMPDMPDIPGMAIPSTGTPTGDLVANGGHTQTGTGTSSGSGSGTGSGSIDSGLGEPATLSSPSVLTTSPNDDATVNIQFTLSRESGVTLYSNNSCSGSTLGSATKPSGTVTMTTTNVPTNATTTIYAKPDGSATCTQVGTYTHDNIDPTISSHSITTSSPGSTLTPTATFTLSETAVITLYTNNSCTTAISSATQKPSGVQTQDSNAISANSTVQFFMQAVDLAGDASLCMTLGSYTHDNQLPSITSATITTTSPSASDLTPDVSFSLNKAATVSLYSDSSCSTSISSSISKSSGSNTLTTDSLTANATVTIYGRAVDSQSNQSSCVSFGTYVHDNHSPSLSSVSVSTSSPGTSQTPTAAFTLSENATVTLYSDSGCTSSISSATSKNSGSQTLNTNSITANSTVTIFAKAVDAASNASSCTSIGSYTHDGTAPSLSSVSVTTSSPGTSLTADVQFTISETSSVTLYSNDSCSSAISSAASKTGAAQTMTTNNLTANTATTIYAKAVDAATNASSCTSIGSYTPDTTAPTAGSAVEFSNVTSSSVTVKWGVASDSVTAASGLSYKLVVAATTGAIDDASEINSASGASVIVDWTVGSSLTWSANKTSANASSMTMYTAYYFAVAVKDAAGRISVYSPQGVTTSCGCSAGQYASGGSCVTAETGYYAASCERTACSNKPTNSGYLGTGYSTNTCEWACSNGYVANSTYTSCNTNNGYVPLSCGSNQLVTGFSGRAAGWIDKIGVRCRNFADGALIGSTIVGTEFGGEGGVSFISDCPNGSAVSEVDYYNHVGNGNNVAGRFRYRCKDLGSGTTSAWIPTSDTG